MLSFHEYQNGMVVMDGNRIVAMARDRASNGWQLHLNGASWTDYSARQPTKITRTVDPSFLNVRTRFEAMTIMVKLSETGRNPK